MLDMQHGRPIRTRFDMKIPAEERLRLRALAEASGRSESAVIRALIREAALRRAVCYPREDDELSSEAA